MIRTVQYFFSTRFQTAEIVWNLTTPYHKNADVIMIKGAAYRLRLVITNFLK
jgi:hypothetical protein